MAIVNLAVWISRPSPCMQGMRNIIPRLVVYERFITRDIANCLFFARVIQRFAAVIMRIREPKPTVLIFALGKMVVTGAKSEDDSRLRGSRHASMPASCKNLASMPSFQSSRSKISSVVVMLSSPFVWKDQHTVTASSAVTSPR